MDTFMDQLSQKLNAQQIIRANGEAESEAMGVMRAQVREYQDCLDRMKNVADELGGLQQTIAALPDLGNGIGIDDRALDDLKAQMENMNRVNEEYLQKMQGDLLASQNDFISRQQDLAQSQNDLMSRQSEMLESRSNELREQIEAIKVSNEEHLERIRSDIEGSGNGGDELANRFDNLALQIEAKIEEIKVYYNEQLEKVRMEIAESRNDELASKLDSLESGLENRFGDIESQIASGMGNLESGISAKFGDMQQGVDLQMGAVKSSNEELLNRMEGALSKDSDNAQVIELIEVLRDEVSAMKIQTENIRTSNDQYLQTMQSNLRRGQEQMIQSQNALSQTLGNTDIHKECVRVYRNVQASVQDENAKQLESIKQENATQLESIKHEGSRNLTAIREESAKLLGSLRNDNSKQVENIREENAKVLVGIKTETSRLEDEVKSVKKVAVFAVIVSVLAVAAPFVAAFLL